MRSRTRNRAAGMRKFWLPSCRGNPSRRGLSAAPQDEVSVSCSELNPHGEEPQSGVSNHEASKTTLFEKLNQQLPIRHFERSPGLLYSLPFGLSALAVPVPFLPLAA